MSIKVWTPKFRVSFPHLFTPGVNTFDPNSKPKYSVVMLFNKKDDMANATCRNSMTALRDAITTVAAEKWGVKAKTMKIRMPLRDGDEKYAESPEKYAAYKGTWYCSATTVQKPGVCDAQLNPIIEPGEVYAGCYAMATANVYAYDQQMNRGVSIGLLNLQKVDDGEPIAGRAKVEDDFEPLEDLIGNI